MLNSGLTGFLVFGVVLGFRGFRGFRLWGVGGDRGIELRSISSMTAWTTSLRLRSRTADLSEASGPSDFPSGLPGFGFLDFTGVA